MLSAFAPLLAASVPLGTWALLQITGFALIWATLDDINAIESFADTCMIYFTVGFGEIVPGDTGPRAGAIIEAFFGVITVALVIGYLPALYAAYSDWDAVYCRFYTGGTDRITPTDLVIAWAPDADPKKIDEQFEKWEQWAAGILETHSTVPPPGAVPVP